LLQKKDLSKWFFQHNTGKGYQYFRELKSIELASLSKHDNIFLAAGFFLWNSLFLSIV